MKLSLLAVAAVVALGAPSLAIACSQEDVASLVAAVSTLPEYQTAAQDEMTATEINSNVVEATALIEQGDFEGACAKYGEIEILLGIAKPEVTEAVPAEAAATEASH